MADYDDQDQKTNVVKEELREMKLEPRDSSNGDALGSVPAVGTKPERGLDGSISPSKRTSQHSSPAKPHDQAPPSSQEMEKDEFKEKVGGDITVKIEPGQPPKLSRSSSQKVPPRAAPLFDHLPDKTLEATTKFQLMQACTYANKYMGYTEHAMECDCAEEWGKSSLPVAI